VGRQRAPAGLTISSTGTISGTPAASGTFTVTVTATAGTTASAALSLVINPVVRRVITGGDAIIDPIVNTNDRCHYVTAGQRPEGTYAERVRLPPVPAPVSWSEGD